MNRTLAAACVLLATTGVAAVFDLRSQRIPRAVSLLGAALGIAVWVAAARASASPDAEVVGIAYGVLGFAVCLAWPLLAEGKIGSIGGGDSLLLGAVGAIVGPLEGTAVVLLAWVLFRYVLPRKVVAPAAPAIFLAAAIASGCRLLL